MILEEIEVGLQFLEPVRAYARKEYRERHFGWRTQYMQSYGIVKGNDVCENTSSFAQMAHKTDGVAWR